MDDGIIAIDSSRPVMKTLRKRAPGDLPRAVSDLVAEGGNVLASDDAPVSIAGNYVRIRHAVCT